MGGGFYDLFFFQLFFFNPREISVGAFSGVENAKMRGSSPEMPKTGSPLAKGELTALAKRGEIPVFCLTAPGFPKNTDKTLYSERTAPN